MRRQKPKFVRLDVITSNDEGGGLSPQEIIGAPDHSLERIENEIQLAQEHRLARSQKQNQILRLARRQNMPKTSRVRAAIFEEIASNITRLWAKKGANLVQGRALLKLWNRDRELWLNAASHLLSEQLISGRRDQETWLGRTASTHLSRKIWHAATKPGFKLGTLDPFFDVFPWVNELRIQTNAGFAWRWDFVSSHKEAKAYSKLICAVLRVEKGILQHGGPRL